MLNNRGFTLIEILMVIVLTGIIAGVAIPNFVDFSKDAKTAVTQSRMNELRIAILGDPRSVANGKFLIPGYRNDMGAFPVTLTDLSTQGAKPAYNPFSRSGWNGPYVNATAEPNWNKDAWGTTFQYSTATRTIRSCGVDTTCGNTDDLTVTF